MASDESGAWIPPAETHEYVGPVDPETCEYAGHEWAPMGGGMEVCMTCEEERWSDDA